MTPPNPPPVISEARLQIALTEALAQMDPRDLADVDRSALERILQENWQRGRMQKFLEGDLRRIPEYVLRVAGFWRICHGAVRALQIERSDEAWQELYRKMISWNYHYLLRQGAYYSDTREFAEACATEAIPILQSAAFPFDVPFEAWARVIVLNVCRKQVRAARKKGAIPPGSLIDLDAIPQDLIGSDEWRPDLRLDLVQALGELNPARQEVMRMIYLEGQAAEEVAETLGRTLSSVYNLHYQAVRELRKRMHNWVNDG